MEWIKVEDSLPEIDQFCIISYGGEVPLIGCYKGKKTWLGSDRDFWLAGENIKWWQPIPEQPKPVEE